MPTPATTRTATSDPTSTAGPARPGRPDAAVLAREAVISFLTDASKATADRAAGIPAAARVPDRMPGGTVSAIDVATLDRIEAAAAKVDADIAVALQAYADLQAGAGAAAEAAVHAAQSALASAGVATEAERQVRISLRQVRQYVVVTVVLLAIVLLVVAVITTTVH
jgi:hypothetical protein